MILRVASQQNVRRANHDRRHSAACPAGPGTTPPTSQLEWLSSTTTMIVLFWSRATRNLLRSFGSGIAALHRENAATKLPFLAARPIASIGPAEKETALGRGPAADHCRLERRPVLNDPLQLIGPGSPFGNSRETFRKSGTDGSNPLPSSGESCELRYRHRRPACLFGCGGRQVNMVVAGTERRYALAKENPMELSRIIASGTIGHSLAGGELSAISLIRLTNGPNRRFGIGTPSASRCRHPSDIDRVRTVQARNP